MMDSAKIDAMLAAAEAASTNSDGGGYYRRWLLCTHRRDLYPQTIEREGDVVLVAECFEGPEHPPVFANHICESDPISVRELVLYVRELEARLA